MCILFLSVSFMKERKPIFQPNELSNAAVTSMRTRIIAGLTAIAIVLPFVIFGDLPFFVFISIVLVFAIIEIIRCAKTKYSKLLYVTTFILAFLILFWNVIQDIPSMDSSWRIYDSYDRITVSVTIMFVGIILTAFTVISDENFTIIDGCFIFMMTVIISLGLESLLYLRYIPVVEHHKALLDAGETYSYFNLYDNCESFFLILFVALGACLNDAFAYFVGVFFGKHKMNPRISPKKTWEGFFGGVFLAGAFCAGFAFIMASAGHPLLEGFLDLNHWWHIVALSFMMPLVSTLGDLVFSSIKRHYQIKDFSNLIPGHGGILDRLDSIMFAAATAAIYTTIFLSYTNGSLILP